MKEYIWEYDKYQFIINMGEEHKRWGDEGILQGISLTVNNYPIIDNNWGVDYNYDYFINYNHFSVHEIVEGDYKGNVRHTLKLNEESVEFKINDYDTDLIHGEDKDEFINWIKSCLSPKNEQIKIKINKILRKKNKKI